jgi:hypothetical protein
MIALRRFWFDLNHPKQWGIYIVISRFFWKIKDYDRLEWDYCSVLCHATNDRMSKPNYDVTTIYSEIDDAKSNSYYSIVKDDLSGLINYGGTIEDVKKYLNGL